jgi:hypothetical protein
MPMIEGTKAIKVWQGSYDFDVDTGATGTYPLRSNDGPIPAGSIILEGWLEVETLFTTSAGATGAVTVEGANDIVNATIVSGAPFSTTGRKSIIPASTGASSVKTTVPRAPSFVIGTGAATAGKFNLVLIYK